MKMFIIRWIIPLILSQLVVCDTSTVQTLNSDTKKISYRWKINNFSKKADYSAEQPVKYSQGSFLKAIPFDFNCTKNSDCEHIDDNMNCYKNLCFCKQNYVYVFNNERKCVKKANIFEECSFSYQCSSTMPNTECKAGKCICTFGYMYNGIMCILRRGQKSKADEIYTAALVAVSCIMVAVTCILIACVVKKSSQLRNYQHRNSRSGQTNDVFTIADEIAAVRATNKPPSYEDVMRNEEMLYGIPPPDYPSLSTLPQYDTSITLPGPSNQTTLLINTIQNEIESTDTGNVLLTTNFTQLPSYSCSEASDQMDIDLNHGENESISQTDIVVNNTNDVNTTRLPEQILSSSSRDESSKAYTNLAFETDI